MCKLAGRGCKIWCPKSFIKEWIHRAEMARKDQISRKSVPFSKKMARGNIDFAWEWHRFGISNSKNAWEWHRFDAKTLESGIVFELGVSISLKKFIVFDPQITKTLESGIVFDVSGEPRAASGSFGEPRRTVDDDDDDSPGYHHPPTPSRPGKKYVVRPGSSLRPSL